MLHAEVTDRELSFVHKMSLQTLQFTHYPSGLKSISVFAFMLQELCVTFIIFFLVKRNVDKVSEFDTNLII